MKPQNPHIAPTAATLYQMLERGWVPTAWRVGSSGIDAENVTLAPELPSIQNPCSAPANVPEGERYFYRSASICFYDNDIDYTDMAVSVINPLNP